MDAGDVAAGVAVAGARMTARTARVAVLPLRIAVRLPVVGESLTDAAAVLERDGARARTRARERVETTAMELLAAPELERMVDRVLAGPLTDGVARSVAQHRVAERVASQVVAELDVDRLVDAVLDDERTQVAVERALQSPGLERLIVQVLESRLLDDVTERVIESPELKKVVEHVAQSPELLDAVTHHTQTLTGEMVADVRARSQRADDAVERTVRSWIRRPRPGMT
jgi:hypothetical protein